MTATFCIGQGGRFQGSNSTCAFSACEGACCIDSGACIDNLTLAQCGAQGGRYQGSNTTCAQTLCTGACCLFDGSCIDNVTFEQCFAQSGRFQGSNTDCIGTFCDGACCLPDGTCEDGLSDVQCSGQGGRFQGANTTCFTSACIGACCLPAGQCVEVTLDMCLIQDGRFNGSNSTCSSSLCDGACCFIDGSCDDGLSVSECDAQLGEFQGSNTFCFEIDCPFAGPTFIIKQGACPAPVNPFSNGVSQMLLVGDIGFDVNQIDRSTLRLFRCDGVAGFVTPNEGPPGPSTQVKDLNHPNPDDVGCLPGQVPCTCNPSQFSDGIDDLSMKFRNSEMGVNLDLQSLPFNTVITLRITGELFDGTFFEAFDCVRIVGPGPDNAAVAVESNGPDAWIETSPADLFLDEGGFANFERYYELGTVVTLRASETHEGRGFRGWRVNGRALETDGNMLMLVVTEDFQLVEAIYDERDVPANADPTTSLEE